MCGSRNLVRLHWWCPELVACGSFGARFPVHCVNSVLDCEVQLVDFGEGGYMYLDMSENTCGVSHSWSVSPRIRVSAAYVGRSLIPRRCSRSWYSPCGYHLHLSRVARRPLARTVFVIGVMRWSVPSRLRVHAVRAGRPLFTRCSRSWYCLRVDAAWIFHAHFHRETVRLRLVALFGVSARWSVLVSADRARSLLPRR